MKFPKTKNTIILIYQIVVHIFRVLWFILSSGTVWLYQARPKTAAQWSYFFNALVVNYVIVTMFWFPAVKALVPDYAPKVVRVVEEKIVEVEKEPEDEAWIANRLKEAGLNPIEAFVIISKESGYTNNENKFGVNTNGTIDAGTWQINSIHYGKKYKHWQTGEELTLTLACVADKYCSTDWAISKRLNDQNWSAWVGAKKAGIK
jgi:hypothetical protein